MAARGSNELTLTLACWDYDRTRPLLDGRVRPEGISLRYVPMKMPESFFRMLRHGEFDASEMSLSFYIRSLFQEPRSLIAIPVFPSRMFRHAAIYVNSMAGIERPQDLKGKRVGVPDYQVTAAVWIKGIMADRYGVPVNSVTYVTGGLNTPGRTQLSLDLPRDVRVESSPAGRTLSEMIETGEIDALYSPETPGPFHAGSPHVRRLFADVTAVEEDYFRDTGIFPIMHTLVLRRDVYERERWIARSLQKAFEEALHLALQDLRETIALKVALPWLHTHVERTVALFGRDQFWTYGLGPNREVLRTFLRYAHSQGLIPRIPEPEELFAPETVIDP